jgi:dTDP-4-dehydrorhamnose reductase
MRLATAIALPSGSPEGTFHLVSRGQCTWAGFATAIVEGAAARGLIPRAPRVVPIATADYPTRARRPAYSVLDVSRLENAFGLQLPDWRAGLDQVLDELARR